MPFPHEEHGATSSVRGWLIVILACVIIVVWGVLNYLLIPDTPHRWDMGVLRDVPGESVYSTTEPAAGATVPKQIAPLPEGKPVAPEAR